VSKTNSYKYSSLLPLFVQDALSKAIFSMSHYNASALIANREPENTRSTVSIVARDLRDALLTARESFDYVFSRPDSEHLNGQSTLTKDNTTGPLHVAVRIHSTLFQIPSDFRQPETLRSHSTNIYIMDETLANIGSASVPYEITDWTALENPKGYHQYIVKSEHLPVPQLYIVKLMDRRQGPILSREELLGYSGELTLIVEEHETPGDYLPLKPPPRLEDRKASGLTH
jgi:hypothetical protein